MEIEIVAPTDIAGEPLSVAVMRRLHTICPAGAVKLTLQFWGLLPEPLTVMLKPQLVPLLVQANVCAVSTSVATPFVWLYTDPEVILILFGAVENVGVWFFIVIEMVVPTVAGVV